MTASPHTDVSPGDAAELIDEALRTEQIVTIFAECEVDYEGRAAGYLGPGDRMIICKPDGTILVHAPDGHSPKNWQPPGGTIYSNYDADHDEVSLHGRRNDPPENITVLFDEIYNLTMFDATDTATLELQGTEKDMHEYILENPDEVEEGLRPQEHERDMISGQIDVFAYDNAGNPVLIEVKRRRASLKHVDQLLRYIKRYRNESSDQDNHGETNVRGILVAPAASDKVLNTLAENELEFVELTPFDAEPRNPANSSLTDF